MAAPDRRTYPQQRSGADPGGDVLREGIAPRVRRGAGVALAGVDVDGLVLDEARVGRHGSEEDVQRASALGSGRIVDADPTRAARCAQSRARVAETRAAAADARAIVAGATARTRAALAVVDATAERVRRSAARLAASQARVVAPAPAPSARGASEP